MADDDQTDEAGADDGEESPPPAPSAPPSPPPRNPRGGGGSGGTLGGLMLGVFGYALLVNFLRGGPKQARAWLAAKFVNSTSDTGPGTGGGTAGNGSRPGAI